MSGLFGHDRFGPEHERARHLAADRLAGMLESHDAEFLATHLAWCAPCRAVRDEYEAQRLELRSLRLETPTPPRDLWARTSAALEHERPVRRPAPTARPGSTPAVVRGRHELPVGAVSGLVVIAIVVGASMVGGQRLLRPLPSAGPGELATASVAATPFPVPVREVDLYRQRADGTIAIVTGRIEAVCPLDVDPACTSARLDQKHLVDLDAAMARAVLESPTRAHVIVVGRASGGSADGVYAVPVGPSWTPTSSPPAPSGALGSPPAGSPAPGGTPPEGTPDPGASAPPAAPSDDPEPAASSSPDPATPGSRPPAGSPDPDDPGGSAEPGTPSGPPDPATSGDPSAPGTGGPDESGAPVASGDPGAAPTDPAPSPSVDVTPRPDGVVEIASDVLVVGAVAAYSPDGSAFAFTARPATGLHGPDVYLWRVGEPQAVPITDDHASVFADWVGGHLLVSRARAASGIDGTHVPVSVLIDPATGLQRLVPATPMWRPTVDPTQRKAVWWDGAVGSDPSGVTWRPRQGRLVLGSWRAPGDAPGQAVAPVDVLAHGTVSEWHARWDETGTRLAVWIADPADPTRGELSLHLIDPTTGRIRPNAALVDREPALAGFSMGAGRLVWVRPGPDGSQTVTVLAWSETGAGQVDLQPAEEPLVVVR